MSKIGFKGVEKIVKIELNDIEKEKLKEFDIIVGNFVFSPKENNVNGYPPASYDYISWLDKYNEISEVPLFFNKFKDASFNNLILENKLEFIISFVKNNDLIKDNYFDSFNVYLVIIHELRKYVFNNPKEHIGIWYEEVMSKVFGKKYYSPLTWDYLHFSDALDLINKLNGTI